MYLLKLLQYVCAIGHCDLDLGHRMTECLPLEYIGFDINGPVISKL